MTIPYGKQFISDDDIAAVVESLKGEYLTQGPTVERFEKAFSEAVGVPYAIAVTNGTAALHLACIALGVSSQTRVITSPITFAASANCVRYSGGSVDFADIDPSSRCISVSAVEAKLRSSRNNPYHGIVAVDFAGYPCELAQLRQLADEYGLWIIEDACHALGGECIDKRGSVRKSGGSADADAAIFSFHPVKHITTGEGGMITTHSPQYAAALRKLRTHGIVRGGGFTFGSEGPWYYEMQELGYNYRMPDILAALGISQLKRLKSIHDRRQAIAERYDSALQGLPLVLPGRPTQGVHAFHLYVVESEQRDDLFTHLTQQGIIPQVHYIPVNYMPYYRSLGHDPRDTPHALAYYRRALSLPMYPSLTDAQQDHVIHSIRAFF